ncbi:MAG: hypothetical protein WED83_00790 [Acidimicrobiia bacterium]
MRKHRYEQIHDLVRPIDVFGEDTDDPKIRELKREWVREQFVRLEELKLMERLSVPGKRPVLFVRKDDGTGQDFDDPDGRTGNSYVSITGGIFASGEMRTWGAPEVAFYLASMIAERYETDRRKRFLGDRYTEVPIGGGQWFRPFGWFGDESGEYSRPGSHVLTPFSISTLERGLKSLAERDLVLRHRISTDPIKRTRFERRRNLYTNQFAGLASEADLRSLNDEVQEYVATASELGLDSASDQ